MLSDSCITLGCPNAALSVPPGPFVSSLCTSEEAPLELVQGVLSTPCTSSSGASSDAHPLYLFGVLHVLDWLVASFDRISYEPTTTTRRRTQVLLGGGRMLSYASFIESRLLKWIVGGVFIEFQAPGSSLRWRSCARQVVQVACSPKPQP